MLSCNGTSVTVPITTLKLWRWSKAITMCQNRFTWTTTKVQWKNIFNKSAIPWSIGSTKVLQKTCIDESLSENCKSEICCNLWMQMLLLQNAKSLLQQFKVYRQLWDVNIPCVTRHQSQVYQANDGMDPWNRWDWKWEITKDSFED